MKKLSKSFSNAFCGVWCAIVNERNFRIHVMLSLLAILLGFYFRIKPSEWLAITIVIGLGLAIELVNTAIENSLDLTHPDQNGAVKEIKDMMAAAVLVVALSALAIAALVFIPYLIK